MLSHQQPNEEANIQVAASLSERGRILTEQAKIYFHFEQYLEAIQRLNEAIILGDADAMNLRAMMHESGQGGVRNLPEAIRLYDQAIARGMRKAMYNRALLHEEKICVDASDLAAFRLYVRAGDVGDSKERAEKIKAKLDERARILHHQGFEHYKANEYKKAIPFIDEAVSLGNANAIVTRALMHVRGQGAPRNDPKAVLLLDEAIKLNNAQAMNDRAWMHYHGRGGDVNLPAAIELYDRAIARGVKEAMYNRARMHEEGRGGNVNDAEAFRLYTLAGDCEDSKKRAEKIKAKLAERGRILYKQAKKHWDLQEYKEAIPLLDKAIELGDTDAMTQRAFMHELGQGDTQNIPEAIRLYEEAIKRDNASAMDNRAHMHQTGRGGSVDLSQAIQLLDRAIARGNRNAMRSRAGLHQIVPDGDLNEAVRLYLQAGDPDSRGRAEKIKIRLARQAAIEKLRIEIDERHTKLVNNAESAENIPAAILSLQELDIKWLKLESDLLTANANPASQRLIRFINQLVNFPESIDHLNSTPNETRWLSEELPPELKPVAQNIVTYLSRQKMIMEYVAAIKTELSDIYDTITNERNSNHHEWQVAAIWRKGFVKGMPAHMLQIKARLERTNFNKPRSLLESYANVLQVLKSVKEDKANRHFDTAEFYTITENKLSAIMFLEQPVIVGFAQSCAEFVAATKDILSAMMFSDQPALVGLETERNIEVVSSPPPDYKTYLDEMRQVKQPAYYIVPASEPGKYPQIFPSKTAADAALAVTSQSVDSHETQSLLNTGSALFSHQPQNVAASTETTAAAAAATQPRVVPVSTSSWQYSTQALIDALPKAPEGLPPIDSASVAVRESERVAVALGASNR